MLPKVKVGDTVRIYKRLVHAYDRPMWWTVKVTDILEDGVEGYYNSLLTGGSLLGTWFSNEIEIEIISGRVHG